MPDDPTTDEAEVDETVAVVHDDIVKRLLDYQRQLREGALVEGDASIVTTIPEAVSVDDDVIDLRDEGSSDDGPATIVDMASVRSEIAATDVESVVIATDEASAVTDLEARIAGMDRSLEQLAAKFADLRSSFQDMAIAADERLADIEELISSMRDTRR